MLEIKNQEDNIIRLSPTCTYDVDGFLYHEDRSMAGVFFFGFDGNPSFNYLRPYPYLGLPPPTFFSIPDPFTFCSSSSGLLLCRDFPTNTYHVFNPFVGTPNSYRHIPAPTRAHQPDTPAILIVDVRQPANPVFHIICAVHEGAGEYTIDTYSSDEGNWSDAVDEVILEDNCRIIASSGVSNGQGMAFWLTSSPHQVVTYTMADGGHSFADLLEVPQGPDPWPTLQLGRLHNAGIGLVVACEANVRLFIHRVGIWCSYGYLNVRRENEEAAGGMEVVCRPPMVMPELLRFEKEVPLFAGERMVLWELIEQGSELRTRLHEMPTWTTIPPNIGDTVPYVTSGLVAAEFR